ncbi:MAG: ABC transporter ATP-binding protein [Alphaproteobacteria bacterium]|nr:MAG: ABC transporter ATP-binding protein [Alphaproteobacteria bacterium]
MAEMLRVEDLSIAFDLPGGSFTAVDRVSFSIPTGGSVALVGESGSGKSVISQAILGILPSAGRVVGGQVWFRDRDTSPEMDLMTLPNDAAWRRIRGQRIALVFQEPMSALSPLHTIGDQVSEALHLHRRLDRAAGAELTRDMLRLVGFPDPKRAFDAYPFELSGGLRQRAVIAMALVCRPALLIADEPTTALDVTVQAQVLHLLKDLQAELRMALLMITHDLGVVANIAEDVVVLWRGKVMEQGPTAELFRAPQHPYLKHLMASVPSIADRPRPTPPEGDAVLRVEGVTKRFAVRASGWFKASTQPPHVAVDSVDLEVRRGECLGLVGESGCGKTTLSKMILHALTPDEGRILWRDDQGVEHSVANLGGAGLKAYRRAVQYVFQDPFASLNPRMTVADIIAEPMVIHGIGTEASRAARVQELLHRVGLDPRHRLRYPHSFSGGQRQRVGIARALALEPRVLLCDEPVSALDVSIQAQILALLAELKRELGLSMLFVSHNLAVVDTLADRIAVMCAGRLVEVAPAAQLFRAPRHPYTTALLAAVPLPDPDRPLDFSRIRDGRASNPAAWPEPWRIGPGERLPLIEVAPGHFVRQAHMREAA